MKLDFNLPKPSELSKSDFYAVNVRQCGSSLKPVGCPPTLFPDAGYRNFRLPSGKILSVGDDRHDLFIDGESVGALSSPFGALLPDGPDDDCIILTTNSAPEWLVGGQLRGKSDGGNSAQLFDAQTRNSLAAISDTFAAFRDFLHFRNQKLTPVSAPELCSGSKGV